MRIGMILDKSFPVDDRVEKEARSLIEAGFEVFLLSFTFGGLPEKESYKGIKIHRVYMPYLLYKKLSALILTFPFYTWFWKKHIRNFIRENRIDVLHVHDLPLCGIALSIKEKFNLPVVADMHENYPIFIERAAFANTFLGRLLISPKKWRKKEIVWLNQADRIIVVAEGMKRRLEEVLMPEKSYTIIPNSPNVSSILQGQEAFPQRDGLTNNRFTVFYFGGVDSNRGLDTLIKAASFLKSKIPELLIRIVGTGSMLAKLRQLAVEEKVEEHIRFEGWQPVKYLKAFIEPADICVIPHLKSEQTDNSSPNKLFIYMMFQKPIIGSNCLSIQQIIERDNCGLIFTSGDSKALAARIYELYKDKDLRLQLGKNAAMAVSQKYDWNETVKPLIHMYRKLFV